MVFERVIDLGQANSSGIGNIYIGRLGTSNDLTFTIEKNGSYTHRATLTNGITNGAWMHVAATVDASGNMTLYVNGTAAATATGVAPDVGVRTNHFVGRSNWAADGAFDGAIDDLIITNGAMSAAAISAMYQQSTPFTVTENAANTTFIGTVLAADPDAANTYTFSLANSAGGRFAINSSTGQLTVANGSLLDFETNSTHTITVRVTDQGGLTYDESFNIAVTNINESPVLTPIGSTSQSATISITADNVYNLFVNGVLVGSDSNWNDIETYTTTLQAGDVVAIEAIDSGSVAAMIGAIDFANGARVVTGADWRISTTLESNWNTTGFNDSNWIRATSHGDRTHSTWNGAISLDADYANLANANWIWAADNIAVNQVYFRYVVSDIPTVNENAANGTAVTRVLARDADAGDTITYSIQSQSVNGAFTINSSTGMVSVADGSLLNFENRTSHSLVVRATDANGLNAERTLTINLNDVNESPVDITLGSTPTGLTTAGNASLVSGTTYQLTPNTNNQAGAVWGAVNLSQDFVITSRAYFGAADGADGLAFALQNQGSNLVGGSAAGFGVNLTSSFGVLFDTHFNSVHNNNINSDFSQFFRQGQTSNQGTTFDTVNAHDNLEDGTWRDLVISWNATSKTLSYSLDGVSIDSIVYDVVATDWGGNANGFFGFGAGTGGSTNQQQVEIISIQRGGITSVAENAANGAVVGVAAIIDPDRTGTVTYSLIGNQGGAFAINSSTGQITVANSSQLSREGAATTLPIIVRATDQGGLTYDETVSITIDAVNDAPTFHAGSGRNFTPISGMQFGNAVAQQTDGKYVMVGWSDAAGTRDFIVARYNFDGSLDTSFGSGAGYVVTAIGTSNDEAQDVQVLADGKILVAGYAINGSNGTDIALVRYNADGSLDTSFGGGTGRVMSGWTGEDNAISMVVQSDGKILVGGSAANDYIVARFNADGSIDTSFGTSGRITTDFTSNSDVGRSIAIQNDGKIIIAGQASNGNLDFGIVRYNTNGTLDTTFGTGGRATVDFGSSSDQAYAVAVQSDGRIVITGFTNVNGTTDVAVARLTSTGALDTTFNGTGRVVTTIGTASDFGMDLKIQSDGKILVGGYRSGTSNDLALVRYNANGTLDSTFNSTGTVTTNFSGSSDDRGTKMFLQADGKIIMAASTSQSGSHDLAIARYNADGSLDTTFNTANTLGGSVSYTENGTAVVLDSDVSIFDTELTPTNFSGATLTIARIGGASTKICIPRQVP